MRIENAPSRASSLVSPISNCARVHYGLLAASIWECKNCLHGQSNFFTLCTIQCHSLHNSLIDAQTTARTLTVQTNNNNTNDIHAQVLLVGYE